MISIEIQQPAKCTFKEIQVETSQQPQKNINNRILNEQLRHLHKLRQDPEFRARCEAEKKAKQEKEAAEAKAIADSIAKEEALRKSMQEAYENVTDALEQVRESNNQCKLLVEQVESAQQAINDTCQK